MSFYLWDSSSLDFREVLSYLPGKDSGRAGVNVPRKGA